MQMDGLKKIYVNHDEVGFFFLCKVLYIDSFNHDFLFVFNNIIVLFILLLIV